MDRQDYIRHLVNDGRQTVAEAVATLDEYLKNSGEWSERYWRVVLNSKIEAALQLSKGLQEVEATEEEIQQAEK